MEERVRAPGGAGAGVVAEFDAVAGVRFEPLRDAYRVQKRRDHPEPVSYLVVEAVAAVTGTSMMDLDPLHETIDADALDAVLTAPEHVGAIVRFDYGGCRIEASSGGELLITER
ncbi:HalOD1 output domain-containing protein [Halobaculum marinum]|uniref:HalOD1 output domain-containing protein n=1 Tax=Halobaculum marinum TaxID=3031996 RepID=A0ABD5WRD1_9EURY|nr:HalOD1 output domain-containing protein [Halobaculum sp. DT55]